MVATKEEIYKATEDRNNYWGIMGGYVNTDGAWSVTSNPDEFKRFLEKEYGFTVTECLGTPHSTAIAQTSDGLEIAWNGFCRKIRI